MVTALPWEPGEAAAPSAEVRRLLLGCRRQGERGAAHAAWLGGRRSWIRNGRAWLDAGVDWPAIVSSCPAETIADLAARLGLARPTARVLFLTALSTIPTYEEAWGLALEHAGGEAHERLRGIRAFEDRVNADNGREISAAEWLCRGQSTDEPGRVCAGRAGPGELYGVVSMTPVARVALKFARRNAARRRIPHVIVVLDAARARGLGARPALYALAFDALRPRPSEEGAHRASKMLHADERQAHFAPEWPGESRHAIRAVAAVGEPGPHDIRRLERTGIPVVALDELV